MPPFGLSQPPAKPIADDAKPIASGKISSQGQITLPLAVRERLGLKPGDRVEFAIENDRTVVRPARTDENPFAKWLGAFPYFNNREEIIAYYREMRGNEENEP